MTSTQDNQCLSGKEIYCENCTEMIASFFEAITKKWSQIRVV